MFDTRSKIVGAAELAARSGNRRIVVGYFDPLVSSHIARLRELAAAGPLLVMVDDPPDPLLPGRARAELVAALGCVEAVAQGSGREAGWTDERPADLERRDVLARHVHTRQKVAEVAG